MSLIDRIFVGRSKNLGTIKKQWGVKTTALLAERGGQIKFVIKLSGLLNVSYWTYTPAEALKLKDVLSHFEGELRRNQGKGDSS